MRFTGQWPGQGVPVNMNQEKQATMDFIRNRGTSRIPSAPTDVIAQSGPRGVLLTWGVPQQSFDIVGWRVYKGDENTLYTEIRDRGNRQCFVESTAATTSPVSNFFISSLNQLGKESIKVQTQKAALNEPGAPTMPGAPPGYSNYSSNRSSGTGSRTGNQQ